jgi:hypothetical protein
MGIGDVRIPRLGFRDYLSHNDFVGFFIKFAASKISNGLRPLGPAAGQATDKNPAVAGLVLIYPGIFFKSY